MLLRSLFCLLMFHTMLMSSLLAQSTRDTTDQWVIQGKDSIYYKPYYAKAIGNRPTLVFVIHGDAPFNKPSYQYRTARLLAERNENVIAIGLLRPGYTDPDNHHSSGERGLTSADNYTPEVVEKLAHTIKELAKRYKASKVIISGHSGGAAITANIISRHPDLAQGAVLVSCPCNVPAFRIHMKELTKVPDVWDVPVKSLSPHEGVAKLSKQIKVLVISGDKDEVALPQYSQEYYQLLQKEKVPVEFINVASEGHEILLNEQVLAAIGKLIK